MSFLIIFLLGLGLIYLFEKDRFKNFSVLEIFLMSFGIGISILTVLGVVVF